LQNDYSNFTSFCDLNAPALTYVILQKSTETMAAVDVNALKGEIRSAIITRKANACPIAMRLAWHASGTYSAEGKSGGSNGATMRFEPEISDGANAGLSIVRDMLLPVQKKHPEIPIADLWTFAGKCAVEFSGGPTIAHQFGRSDAANGSACPINGLLPDASQGAKHLRDVFYRQGFNDREIVALSGGHTLGRCHKVRSGFDGPWTSNPLKFDNSYFTTLMGNKWVKRKWDGPEQFEDEATGLLMMLPTDLALKTDPVFRKVVEEYAADEKKFFEDFKHAFEKLISNGCPEKANPHKCPVKKADKNASADFRENAMHGSVGHMRKALANGADVHSLEASSGRTALHKAAFWGHIDATNFLLKDCKVDPNPQDYNGDTPLHDAARFGHLDVVEALVAGGATPSVENVHGKNVAQVAADYDKDDVVALLNRLGGKSAGGSAVSLDFILKQAKKAGKSVDVNSVAFTLGFVAGSKVSVASDDAPALPAAAASAKE